MLKLDNISYQIPEKILFKNLSASLYSKDHKKVALIGANGCGKSTLIKIIMGELKPDSGLVLSQDEIIGYVPQKITLPTQYEMVGEYLESLLSDSWQQYLIDIVLSQLSLSDDYIYKKMATLSGGETVKVKLAAVLLQEPTILIMDEPTNHLDEKGINWLSKFINDFNGSVLMVTHNRQFINKNINQIWEVNPTTLELDVVTGNYDDFIDYKEKTYQHDRQVYDNYFDKVIEIKSWLKANEFHPKYRFSSIVGSKKRALSLLEKNPVLEPVAIKRIKFHPLDSEIRGRLLKVVVNKKQFDDKVILKDLEIVIKSNQRWQIAGPNGAGKSTLLKILTGKDKNFDGDIEYKDDLKIGYLQQLSTLDLSKNILTEFEQQTQTIEPQSRKILARYGFGKDMVFRNIDLLSYGERRRLELAIILAQAPDILFLDEPTNHLDIYMMEAIENFLIEVDIAMVVVSHDQYFMDKIGIMEKLEL